MEILNCKVELTICYNPMLKAIIIHKAEMLFTKKAPKKTILRNHAKCRRYNKNIKTKKQRIKGDQVVLGLNRYDFFGIIICIHSRLLQCRALLLQNLLCVSSEAAVAMREGLSMGEASNLHHQTCCMLRCSKEQGGERYNRCVCKSRTYSEAAMRSR